MSRSYVKSPLNYVGGKYKLLNEIIPLLTPCTKINKFIDLFGGGFNVGVNVISNSVVYNDICVQVTELLKYIKYTDIRNMLLEIEDYIEQYKLEREGKDGYLKLRQDYNSGKTEPLMLYTLLCCSFSNQIRFNKQGKFNMPYGERNFNKSLREKFIAFSERLHTIDCIFTSLSFEQFDFSVLTSNDLVYCDPPYLNSFATYNENGGWTEEDEATLLSLLDELNAHGIRFALSNNLKYNNPLVDIWKDKYNVHFLNADYNNCNYHKKDKSRDKEILVTNY